MYDAARNDAQSFWFGLGFVFGVTYSVIEHAVDWFNPDGRGSCFGYDAKEVV